MTKVNLTKKLIDNIEATTNEQVFYDIKTTGLHLKVSPEVKKDFTFTLEPKMANRNAPSLAILV